MEEPTGTGRAEAVPGHLHEPARTYYRIVIQYFRRQSPEVATVDDLATVVRNQADADEARIALYLHHDTLPRLADAGYIEYDTRSNTARYRGRPSETH